MIKAKISREKDIVRATYRGTPHGLCLETATMISDIYRGLQEKNPEAAAEFKQTLLVVLLSPNSPVWEVETE